MSTAYTVACGVMRLTLVPRLAIYKLIAIYVAVSVEPSDSHDVAEAILCVELCVPRTLRLRPGATSWRRASSQLAR